MGLSQSVTNFLVSSSNFAPLNWDYITTALNQAVLCSNMIPYMKINDCINFTMQREGKIPLTKRCLHENYKWARQHDLVLEKF